MGEWSEYFDDFPEENPASYDEHGRYDPQHKLRDEQRRLEIANRSVDALLGKKGVAVGIGKPRITRSG